MSGLLKVIPNLVASTQKIAVQFLQKSAGYHTITAASSPSVNPGGLFSLSVRNVIRVHFPRPSETKRIKRHGWNKRMSTPAGRRVLMNRILKGRWVYSH